MEFFWMRNGIEADAGIGNKKREIKGQEICKMRLNKVNVNQGLINLLLTLPTPGYKNMIIKCN